MTNELAGNVALITGASKGIGGGIATAFDHAGANVAVGYIRDQHAAQRVATDIEALITKTVATFGPLDTVVNNAGVFDYKALADIAETHFHHIYDSNVLGMLTTTRFAVANFNHTGGSVINISSLSAVGNATGRAVYASSKAAVNAITKVLALELAERKIRVNAIMPATSTRKAHAVSASKAPTKKPNSSPPLPSNNDPATPPTSPPSPSSSPPQPQPGSPPKSSPSQADCVRRSTGTGRRGRPASAYI